MGKKRLLYKIEILLSILILIILIIGFKFIFNPKDNAISEEVWFWDSNKAKILEGEGGGINVYNLNPSTSSKIYRIVVIGDSVVYSGCPSVDLIEEKLNDNSKKNKIGKRTINEFNVVNAALGASNIDDVIHRMRFFKDNNIRVDMLLVQTGWNEHWYDKEFNPCVRIGCYRNIKPLRWLLNLTKSENRIIKNLATKAFLYQRDKDIILCEEVFKDNLKLFLEGIDHYNTSVYRISLDSYEQRLIELIEDFRKEGTEIILVTPPDGLTKGEVPEISMKDCTLMDKESYFNVHHLYVNKLKEVANEFSIPVLDLDALFEEIPDFKNELFRNASIDHIHPNSLGNEYCSEFYYQKIFSILEELGLLID